VTHLLASEDGPGDVVVRVRRRLGSAPLGELMDCFQCLSIWVAAPLTLVVTRRRDLSVATWLALSGAACLLEGLVEQSTELTLSPEPAEGGEANGLLWSATGGPVDGAEAAP
jgi:hypothetical protein